MFCHLTLLASFALWQEVYFSLQFSKSAVFPEWLLPVCCMAAYLSHIRRNRTKNGFFSLVTTGLWTLEKCLRPFPTEPKHFLPLRRLMVWMCASLACMSRNMVLSAHSPTLGRHIWVLCVKCCHYFCYLAMLTMRSFPLSICADGSTYHTLTVFTSLDLAFYGLQYTMRSSLDTWNMSRNLGVSAWSSLLQICRQHASFCILYVSFFYF